MKIAFVSDAIYPYNKGGKEKRLYELSTRLAKLGHEIHIYTMHWWSAPEKTHFENGVYLHALSPRYEMYHGDRRSLKEAILFGVACLKLFAAQFDIIDVDHMPFFPIFSVWLVCLLRGKKLYGTWHESLSIHEWVAYMGKAGYVAALIEALSIRLPYRITAASSHTRMLLSQHHGRSKGVEVVASGIDKNVISKVKPAPVPYDVLYVGRFVKDKHVDILIKAMAIVAKQQPYLRCAIIGHGVEHNNLERLVRRLKLTRHVSILPPLAEATDVYAYMKRAKVFVLPSVREGFGIVALEALSCGTPVITVDSPANAGKDLIIEDETGSVVSLDARNIAAAILHWTSTGKRKLTISSTIADYDWQALALKQVDIYAA